MFSCRNPRFPLRDTLDFYIKKLGSSSIKLSFSCRGLKLSLSKASDFHTKKLGFLVKNLAFPTEIPGSP